MTVTYHGEDYSARTGKNDLGKRSYTRVFKLETSEKIEDIFDVGSHVDLPLIGDPYPRDPVAYCQSLSVACVGGWKQWTVTANYKIGTSGKEEDPPEENPENDSPVITFSSEIYQEPVFRDVNDKAVVNTAGDYFTNPAPMRDAAHLVIKVKKNYLTAPEYVLTYQNSVNAESFSIEGLQVAEQTARISRFELSEVKVRGDYSYRELSFEFHVHQDGWRSEILNAGLMQKGAEIDKDSGLVTEILEDERVPCKDSDGEPVTSPVALDKDGLQIKDPSTDNCWFEYFQLYPEVDFSILPGVDEEDE